MKKLLIATAALIVVGCNAPEQKASAPVGAWKVDPAQSTLSFVSVKKDSVAESHSFKTLSGDGSADGDRVAHFDTVGEQTHQAARLGRAG